jgi:hypothetical protein
MNNDYSRKIFQMRLVAYGTRVKEEFRLGRQQPVDAGKSQKQRVDGRQATLRIHPLWLWIKMFIDRGTGP